MLKLKHLSKSSIKKNFSIKPLFLKKNHLSLNLNNNHIHYKNINTLKNNNFLKFSKNTNVCQLKAVHSKNKQTKILNFSLNNQNNQTRKFCSTSTGTEEKLPDWDEPIRWRETKARLDKEARENPVKFKYFLHSGVAMPSMIFGTWKIHPTKMFKALDRAIDVGYRHIDTAPIYRNEESIGNSLKKIYETKGIQREDLFLTSKLWPTHYSKQKMREALFQTLKDLDTDYLDSYLLNWPFCLKDISLEEKKKNQTESVFWDSNFQRLLPIGAKPIYERDWAIKLEEVWYDLNVLKKEGYVRSTGVANFSNGQLRDLMDVSEHKPAVNQIECHPLLNQFPMRAFCEVEGIHVTAFSPFGSGTNWKDQVTVFGENGIRSIALQQRRPIPQILIRWILQSGMSCCHRSENPNHISSNFKALTEFHLDSKQMKYLDDRHIDKRYISPIWAHHPKNLYQTPNRFMVNMQRDVGNPRDYNLFY